MPTSHQPHNHRRFLFAALIAAAVWVLVGCRASPETNLEQSQPPATRAPAPTATPIKKIFPTATLTPTITVTPTCVVLTPVIPSVVQLCPPNREVSFSEMGFSEEYWLVRTIVNYSDLFNPTDPRPIIIPLDNLKTQILPSPVEEQDWELIEDRTVQDGRTIELFYERIGGGEQQLWHSSWDGQNQILLDAYDFERFFGEYYRVSWSDTFTIINRINLDTFRSFPVAYLDPVSKQVKAIEVLPDNYMNDQYASARGGFYSDGVPYLIYVYKEKNYMLLNLETHKETQIFVWLANRDDVIRLNTVPIFQNGKFIIQSDKEYGFDISAGIDITELAANYSYEEIMQPIILPDPISSSWSDFRHFTENGFFFARDNSQSNMTEIYFLDLESMVLNDYCYSIGNSYSPDSWTWFEISPDQRFVACSYILQEGDVDIIQKIEILDLQTGNIAVLNNLNYIVIGWGKR